MTRGDLVVITPVSDDLIVNKTGTVQNHFMLSMFSQENRINQLEMRESTKWTRDSGIRNDVWIPFLFYFSTIPVLL